MIFVFGSNFAGVHGAGAALEAYKRGFPLGMGVGYHSPSHCYAIPTKDNRIRTLSLSIIKMYIDSFIDFTKITGYSFQITRIGCGYAGYNDAQIAPMFSHAPSNCHFDSKWHEFLGPFASFWGTY